MFAMGRVADLFPVAERESGRHGILESADGNMAAATGPPIVDGLGISDWRSGVTNGDAGLRRN